MTSKVLVSKGLLAGLVGIAASMAFGLVFLLGRASVHSAPMETPRPPASESDQPAVAAAVPAPVSPASAAVPADQPTPPAPAAAKPAVSAPPRNAPARAAVVAYFKAVESIQPAPGGDPEAVAQQIAMGLGNGDTSGIDGMIQQARETRSRLSALTPPQPCAAYHRELLASLDAGLDLMQGIKKLVGSPNPSMQAAGITDRANAMKVHSDSLRNQERDLKQRYCD
jgi:hypothetical protein